MRKQDINDAQKAKKILLFHLDEKYITIRSCIETMPLELFMHFIKNRDADGLEKLLSLKISDKT